MTFTAMVYVEADEVADCDLLELAFGHGMDETLRQDVEGFRATCGEDRDIGTPGALAVTLNPDNGVDYTEFGNRKGLESDIQHAMRVGLAKHADGGSRANATISPAEVCDHPREAIERKSESTRGGVSWLECTECGCPVDG